jgi:hypothetical protein
MPRSPTAHAYARRRSLVGLELLDVEVLDEVCRGG